MTSGNFVNCNDGLHQRDGAFDWPLAVCAASISSLRPLHDLLGNKGWRTAKTGLPFISGVSS